MQLAAPLDWQVWWTNSRTGSTHMRGFHDGWEAANFAERLRVAAAAGKITKIEIMPPDPK